MSEIFVDTIKNKAGSTSLDSDKLPDMLSGSAKAWLYQSSGGLVESFNTSSHVDNSTGNSSYNLTSAMASTNGNIPVPTCRTSDDRNASALPNSASQFTVYSRDISSSGAMEDSNILATTHGDLA